MILTSNEIVTELRKLIRRKTELDKKPRPYGTDLLLHNAEIFLIETIGKYPGRSLTFLAYQMNQTKGAVSQTLKRLEGKDCVLKEADPLNSSRLLISLSEEGRTALEAHKIWHGKQDSDFLNFLDNLDVKEKQLICDFLGHFSDFIDE